MKLCIIFFSFLFGAGAQALDTDTRMVLRSISERYKTLGAWRARFSQETFSTGLGKGTFNAGEMTFVPPNKFSYSIVGNDASHFISNGHEAWQILYRSGPNKDPFVRHFKKISSTGLDRYLLFVRGIDTSTSKKEAALLKDFDAKGEFQNGDLTLELKPKHSSELTTFVMIFKNDSEAPYRVILNDAVGTRTTITVGSFEQIKDKVEEKTFRPNYPKGSKVEEL